MKIEITATGLLNTMLNVSEEEALMLVVRDERDVRGLANPVAALISIADYDDRAAYAIHFAVMRQDERSSQRCGGARGNIALKNPMRETIHDVEHLAMILVRNAEVRGATIADPTHADSEAIVALTGRGAEEEQLLSAIQMSVNFLNEGIELFR